MLSTVYTGCVPTCPVTCGDRSTFRLHRTLLSGLWTVGGSVREPGAGSPLCWGPGTPGGLLAHGHFAASRCRVSPEGRRFPCVQVLGARSGPTARTRARRPLAGGELGPGSDSEDRGGLGTRLVSVAEPQAINL